MARKPKFYQMVLKRVPLEDVINHVYPDKPKGFVTLEERLPNNCACEDCGHNTWMIRPIEVKDRDGGKPYVECLNCGGINHL